MEAPPAATITANSAGPIRCRGYFRQERRPTYEAALVGYEGGGCHWYARAQLGIQYVIFDGAGDLFLLVPGMPSKLPILSVGVGGKW